MQIIEEIWVFPECVCCLTVQAPCMMEKPRALLFPGRWKGAHFPGLWHSLYSLIGSVCCPLMPPLSVWCSSVYSFACQVSGFIPSILFHSLVFESYPKGIKQKENIISTPRYLGVLPSLPVVHVPTGVCRSNSEDHWNKSWRHRIAQHLKEPGLGMIHLHVTLI